MRAPTTSPSTCRCGHGRHVHRATRSALAQARRAKLNGLRVSQPHAGCRWMATGPTDRKICPCRKFVGEE